MPEFMFDKFSSVSAEFLLSQGVKGIILDIDNTLEPYENAVPGDALLAWFSSLSDAGIVCAFVSNNNRERVELFNKELGYVAYYKAGKPFKKNVIKAMSDIGCDRSNTIMMGDQVFTDVIAAHNAGLRAILLPPIKDKTDAFTKFKRWLEKPVIKKYNKGKNL